MTLTPTEQDELRIAIAEEMGWKWHYGDCCKSSGAHYWNKGNFDYRTATSHAGLPPYTTSIDAIQAACLERFKTAAEQNNLSYRLGDRALSIDCNFWQLAPLDWCISFARTAKIWRYKV